LILIISGYILEQRFPIGGPRTPRGPRVDFRGSVVVLFCSNIFILF